MVLVQAAFWRPPDAPTEDPMPVISTREALA